MTTRSNSGPWIALFEIIPFWNQSFSKSKNCYWSTPIEFPGCVYALRGHGSYSITYVSINEHYGKSYYQLLWNLHFANWDQTTCIYRNFVKIPHFFLIGQSMATRCNYLFQFYFLSCLWLNKQIQCNKLRMTQSIVCVCVCFIMDVILLNRMNWSLLTIWFLFFIFSIEA
jgi:hypothetical protein